MEQKQGRNRNGGVSGGSDALNKVGAQQQQQTQQTKQTQRICTKCNKEFSGTGVRFPDGRIWCRDCAVCDSCRKPIWNQQWAPWPDGNNYCMTCLQKRQFGQKQ